MAITATDILYKFSVSAAAGNTTAGTAATSLGDQISTTQITDASLHNLFDVITGDENAASDVEYRCYFVHNNHGSLTASVAISVDTTGVTALGSGSAQAKNVADESTAPSGQTFTSPTTKGTGLSVGNIGPGQVAAIWVRRTAANTAALDSDGVTIRFEGDTAA
jgi:hypothetical protein